ncbi:MAG TPA: aminotransferase class V-fold PLP-dependent enzyme, partial [Lacipirellulaceae bacterium]
MASIPTTVTPPVRTLLGPGPSDVHPRVLAALARPTVGHLDPYYLRVMDELQGMLREVFRTKNRMTMAISGTGSAGQEATVLNLVEPGERVLVCVNGVFGGRLADMAERAGGQVTKIERPWGEVFDFAEVKAALAREKPEVVAIVMAETSTGAWQPVEEIAAAVRDTGAMLILDTVTALGGIPVEIDKWQVDAVYSGTQKCLSCPPGLAPVSFSDRAVEKILKRREKVRSWYLDISLLANYWGSDRVYHHTAPINMTYALHEALRLLLEEGLEACFARHRKNHQALKAGLAAVGISYATQAGHALPQLNAVRIPSGVDDLAVRKSLLERFGIEIGAGLGAFKEKVWR